MGKQLELSDKAFQMDGKMPLSQAIPLGLQHVLAMFVGNLTPLLIITGACGIAGGDFADLQLALLQNAMLLAGIVTLVQLFGIGPVGGRVPVIMGTSSGFIGVFNSVAASMGGVAKVFITVSMVLFAFTTLLGNLYYVDNCFAYIMKAVPGPTFNMVYRAIACVVIFIGAGSSMGLMWDLADVLMGCMAIINLPVICILGGPALKAMDDYSKQRDAMVDAGGVGSTVSVLLQCRP